MKDPRKLLWKTLVREYYRQNAGFFLFFFILFFGIVAPSQQLAYHYSIILGMLSAPLFLALALFLWLFYAIKCVRWVIGCQQSASHGFLQMLPLAGRATTFRLLLEVQVILYLPIIGYAIIVIMIAVLQSAWLPAALITCFVVVVCLSSVFFYWYDLLHPGICVSAVRFARRRKSHPTYWSFLLRCFLSQHKALLIGIKLFVCAILYLLLKIQAPGDYDIRMPFLVFSVAVFGHGALIYQARKLEEEKLLFYRSLPVTLARRMLQYMILYLLVMTPEIITIGWLMPEHIRIRDAFGFVLAEYTTLLLLNSFLFIARLEKSDFIKLCLGIFGILYVGILSDGLIILSGLFLATAGGLFFRGYCRWEG